MQDIPVTEITKLPDVLSLKTIEDEETIEQEILEVLKEAILNFVQMRMTEGTKIKQDLLSGNEK